MHPKSRLEYALTFGGPLLLGGRAADLLGRPARMAGASTAGLARLCVVTSPELPAPINTPMEDENAA
jgi:hypothetical protein